MLRGCAPRQLTWPSRVRSLQTSTCPRLVRTKSSTAHGSRSPADSIRATAPSRWARLGLGSVVVGVAIITVWGYYERQQKESAFINCKLIARQPVSSTASIFYLSPTGTLDELKAQNDVWKKGIWNFDFKQPQIQIVRAYTPLPPIVADQERETSTLRFLIRHDPQGEVSSYLHRLPIGSEIDIRGPNIEYTLKPDVKQVLFFAGGTGIAPALQIAHAMLGGQSKPGTSTDATAKKSLHIYWANRRREDCEGGISETASPEKTLAKAPFVGLFGRAAPKVVLPSEQESNIIVQELEELKKKYPGQVTVEYFVNAEGTWIDEHVVYNSLSRFDDKDFSKGVPSPSEQRQILISGPEGFIAHLAGPKEWSNGREQQGNVGKIMARAVSQHPAYVSVWKV